MQRATRLGVIALIVSLLVAVPLFEQIYVNSATVDEVTVTNIHFNGTLEPENYLGRNISVNITGNILLNLNYSGYYEYPAVDQPFPFAFFVNYTEFKTFDNGTPLNDSGAVYLYKHSLWNISSSAESGFLHSLAGKYEFCVYNLNELPENISFYFDILEIKIVNKLSL